MGALSDHWQIVVASMAYRAVGFGSHHWEVVDSPGCRWFVTVDEVAAGEPFRGLAAALGAATDLRLHGLEFVVAPVPTRDGAPVAALGEGFAVAVYPFVSGQSFDYGSPDPAQRDALLRMVVEVHKAPAAAARRAMVEDFVIAHRESLSAALDGVAVTEVGPFTRAAAALVVDNADAIRGLSARYDELAAEVDALPVLTHGEPHPGNTMLTPDGWVLVDWDTALIAPPERDLWSLDPGDGSLLAAYTEATGVQPQPDLLELYRLRWDLGELAGEVDRFRLPHARTRNDVASWELLVELVGRLES